jgi:hypothetical protein
VEAWGGERGGRAVVLQAAALGAPCAVTLVAKVVSWEARARRGARPAEACPQAEALQRL